MGKGGNMKDKEMTQDEIIAYVKHWDHRCRGCINMDCDNSWKNIAKCIITDKSQHRRRMI